MSPEKNGSIRSLQLGKSWFPEQAGSGLDRVYHALVQHLPHVGVGVTGIVAGSPDVAHSTGRVIQAFAPHTDPLSRRIAALRGTMRRIRREQLFDVVAAHFALYTFPILDLLPDKPLIIHFHGPWAQESRVEGEHALVVKAKAALERAVYRKGVRFIVLSKAFRDILRQAYGVPEEHIRIVPGGAEVRHFATGRPVDDPGRDASHGL